MTLTQTMESNVAHTDDWAKYTFVNESFTEEELDSVAEDGGLDLMTTFNYTMAARYVKP